MSGIIHHKYFMYQSQWVADGKYVQRYYQNRISRYGQKESFVAAQDWQDRKRYQKVCQIVLSLLKYKRVTSIYDVGCGTGLFYSFMKVHRKVKVYDGIELVPEFVVVANQILPRPSIVQGNFVQAQAKPRQYDLVVNLGGLNSRMSDHSAYLYFMIEKMLRITRKYVIFNVITHANATYFPKGSKRIGHITTVSVKGLRSILRELRSRQHFHTTLRTVTLYPNSSDTFVLLERKLSTKNSRVSREF